jgi:hypothetical protein
VGTRHNIFNSHRLEENWCTSLISLRSARIAPRKTTGWKRAFDDPIPLPRGRHPVTLKDAGNYIARLAPAEHEAAEWQAAMEALMLVATHGGPPMFARIGIMPALKRNVAREFDPDRKDTCWGGRKLKRDLREHQCRCGRLPTPLIADKPPQAAGKLSTYRPPSSSPSGSWMAGPWLARERPRGSD